MATLLHISNGAGRTSPFWYAAFNYRGADGSLVRVKKSTGAKDRREAQRIAALPGIGRSTAAAIAAFAFGERAAILDGNVKRVLARHRGVEGFPGAPKVEARLWEIAQNAGRQLRDAARPFLQDMFSLVGETIHLAVREPETLKRWQEMDLN